MSSVQSSLLFLYYVEFSTVYVSVGFSVHSVQSQSAQFLKHSVYRVESVAYIVNGVQC